MSFARARQLSAKSGGREDVMTQYPLVKLRARPPPAVA